MRTRIGLMLTICLLAAVPAPASFFFHTLGKSSNPPFLESFENFSGGLPSGWTDCGMGTSPFSGIGPTQNGSSGITDGTKSGYFSIMDTGYTGASCIRRTIDLTGYSNVSLDVTDAFGCLAAGTAIEVYFYSPVAVVLTANAAGTRSATFAPRGMTDIKVIIGGYDCALYVDRLRFW